MKKQEGIVVEIQGMMDIPIQTSKEYPIPFFVFDQRVLSQFHT